MFLFSQILANINSHERSMWIQAKQYIWDGANNYEIHLLEANSQISWDAAIGRGTGPSKPGKCQLE